MEGGGLAETRSRRGVRLLREALSAARLAKAGLPLSRPRGAPGWESHPCVLAVHRESKPPPAPQPGSGGSPPFGLAPFSSSPRGRERGSAAGACWGPPNSAGLGHGLGHGGAWGASPSGPQATQERPRWGQGGDSRGSRVGGGPFPGRAGQAVRPVYCPRDSHHPRGPLSPAQGILDDEEGGSVPGPPALR